MSTAIYVSYLQKDPKTGEPYKFDVDYYLNTHMRLVQEHWYVRACLLAFHSLYVPTHSSSTGHRFRCLSSLISSGDPTA